LTNEIFLADDPITDSLISFGNDLSSESDKANEKSLLFGCFFQSLDLVTLVVRLRLLLLQSLLLLDLVNSLVQKVLGVIDSG